MDGQQVHQEAFFYLDGKWFLWLGPWHCSLLDPQWWRCWAVTKGTSPLGPLPWLREQMVGLDPLGWLFLPAWPTPSLHCTPAFLAQGPKGGQSPP